MTDDQRVLVVDYVCTSSCAAPFDLFLNATRTSKGCGMGTIFGFHHHHHRHHHHHNWTTPDGEEEEEEEEEEHEVVSESQELQQPMTRRLRGSEHKEEGFADFFKWMGGLGDKEEMVDDDDDDDHHHHHRHNGTDMEHGYLYHNGSDDHHHHRYHHHQKGGMLVKVGDGRSPSSSFIMKYQPAHLYPGLLLGCTKDKKDNQYCAVKPADLMGGGVSGCHFFKSCCYGEMLALLLQNNDHHPSMEKVVAKVEEKCPGSAIFAAMKC